MNWILVVLQATSLVGTNVTHTANHGWTTIGQFASEKACVAASVQMSQASQGTRGVKNFQCLKRD